MTGLAARRRSIRAGLVALVVGAALACTATLVQGQPENNGDGGVQVPVAAGFAGSALRANDTAEPPRTTTVPSRSTTPEAPPAPSTSSPAPASSSLPPSSTPAPSSTPKPTSTAATSPVGGQATDAVGEVVQLVNQARTANGCQPMKADSRLTTAAQQHASDMSDKNYFSHDSADGTTFAERIIDAGYPRPGAENIAKGQRDAQAVMDAWMNSDGHRANILNCKLTAIGVGLDTRGWYWVQDFGY